MNGTAAAEELVTMNTSTKIASLLATLATACAVGCAAPTDSTGSDSSQRPTKPIVDDPGIDPNDDDAHHMFQAYDVGAKSLRQDVAKLVMDKLKDHAVSMMLNKIGIGGGSSGELDDMLKQLQQLKEQLTRTHNELQASIAASTLNAKVTASIEDMAIIRLTLDRYENIARLEKEIALAREKGDEGLAANLSFGMEDRVQEFVNMFDAGGRMAVALERLHLTIAGSGFGEENLIELYRWKLRASGRNLTNAHSESLATGLAFFEEYEAIAALLMAECNAAVLYGNDGSGKWPKVTSKTCSRDPRANDRLNDKLEVYIGDQRGKLPAVIPPGMMIDQGPTFGGVNDTTHDKPLYYSLDGNHPWRPSDTINTPGSVRHVVASFNVVGGSDFKLPSEAELRPLFAGNRTGESNVRHLNRIFGTHDKFAGQSFIWNTGTRGQLVQYDGGGGGKHVNVTTHAATFISAQSAVVTEARPLFPMNTERTREATQAMIDRMWADVRGGIVVLGNTGPTNYL